MEQVIRPARHSAMDFAKYIITVCTNIGNAISDLQLQKVLYYVQIEFIRIRHEDAFEDDMEAWPYGPVVRSVYENFASYGSTKICLEYDDADVFSEGEKEIIHAVVYSCINCDVWELVAKSHIKDGPWDTTFRNGSGYKAKIPKKLIREYALR